MKKSAFLTILFSILVLSISYAQGQRGQEPRTPEERAQRMTNRMEKQLTLTAEQKEQIYEINLEAAQKNEELRQKKQSGETEPQELRGERQAIAKDVDTKILALLDEEQKGKYEQMKENARNRAEERRGRRKGNKDENDQ